MVSSYSHTDWAVLLIGGSSGTGKTILAEQLGLRLGISWFQGDDLRLALQRSRVTLPEHTEALYFFEKTPRVWELPAERLCDGLIAVGQVLTPAIYAQRHTQNGYLGAGSQKRLHAIICLS